MIWDNVSVVVPARLESSRVEKKVLQTINYYGRELSLLEVKIIELLKIFPKERVVLSAGEDVLENIAEKYQIVYSRRGEEFYRQGYTKSTEDSIREILKDVETEYVAWCPPVVPFHNASIIDNALKFYFDLGAIGSVATSVEMKSYFWWKGKPLNYFPDSRHVQSQLLEPLQRISNGLYVGRTEELRSAGYFLVDPIKFFRVGEIEALDIDNQEDLLMAKSLSKRFYEI